MTDKHLTIHDDHLISLINGKPYVLLTRQLTKHGYTPESYREALELPPDYPMVPVEFSHRGRKFPAGLTSPTGGTSTRASGTPIWRLTTNRAYGLPPERPRKPDALAIVPASVMSSRLSLERSQMWRLHSSWAISLGHDGFKRCCS